MKVPELVMRTLPPPVVINEPERVKLLPTKVMPPLPELDMSPLIVQVPVELARFKELQEKLLTVMSRHWVTVTAPKAVVSPALCATKMLPVPVLSVRPPGPFTAALKVIG